ncbi:MAG: type II secretion system F family protein [Actinomycetota bacterium]
MTPVIASAFALGLLLIYDGCTSARSTGVPSLRRLDRLASGSGIHGLSGAVLLAITGTVVTVTFVLAAAATSSMVVSLSVALVVGSSPITIVRSRARRRAVRLRDEWPDAIAGLIASIRAGVSLPEACAGLAGRAGEGLRPGVEVFIATYRSNGSFSAALEEMRKILADPIADRVVVALGVAHEVGGTDLVRVLRTLGDFIREDIRVRKEIEARWSWTVTAARVAAAAPWAVLLMMSLRPEAARAFDSATGAAVIFFGAAATVVGYQAMLRAARLPAERRLNL